MRHISRHGDEVQRPIFKSPEKHAAFEEYVFVKSIGTFESVVGVVQGLGKLLLLGQLAIVFDPSLFGKTE